MFDLTTHTIAGSEARSIAVPLGGIGTGSVAVAADGSLRQWQLVNGGRHRGHVPATFLAMRTLGGGNPDQVVRLLQTSPVPEDGPGTPFVDDDVVPPGVRDLVAAIPPMAKGEFRATYPVAELSLHDPATPVEARIQWWAPLAPLDVDMSSIPAILIDVELRNPSAELVFGWLGASAQNAVGWDGSSTIRGIGSSGYGGNRNSIRSRGAATSLVMENRSLAGDDPRAGQMVLTVRGNGVQALPQYGSIEDFRAFLEGCYTIDHWSGAATAARVAGEGSFGGIQPGDGPSPTGATWNGALAVPFRLEAGQSTTIQLSLAWSFPNRYVNFTQFNRDFGKSRLWLGNAYTAEHPDAVATADVIEDQRDALGAATSRWLTGITDGSLPARWQERLAAQAAFVRSPTLFRAEDGHVYGFEGIQGASTPGWADNGGSCPLNCTHVWNYAQALSRLFPNLERDMRDTEFDLMQGPDGAIAHRVIVPRWARQSWNEPIGGPASPALDGMLGTILKTLRELQLGAPKAWLAARWPALRKLFEHIRGRWDPDSCGLLRGAQPSTHDIDLQGLNLYIGGYWLAALLALERLADLAGEPDVAATARELFTRGSVGYDKGLFNGDYYEQSLNPDDPRDFAWGSGLMSDQLVGQWWAHQLGLGHILPVEHIRSTLASIVRHNLRHGFADLPAGQRPFATANDVGLLNVTWPRGSRPTIPVNYCDEVWTGVEYQVAAHLLYEGMGTEADLVLDAVWDRYDGRKRNPYNEVECGDHYARAMAGFSLLPAASGVFTDATRGLFSLTHKPAEGWRMPFFAGTGWGTVAHLDGELNLDLIAGYVDLTNLDVPGVTPLESPIRISTGDVLLRTWA